MSEEDTLRVGWRRVDGETFQVVAVELVRLRVKGESSMADRERPTPRLEVSCESVTVVLFVDKEACSE